MGAQSNVHLHNVPSHKILKGRTTLTDSTFTKHQFTLESWISLQQDQFLLVTQAFASPPDMASSGVWENIILPKTPTFEGVSGILYYIIFLNLLPNFWYCWQMVSQLLLCWQILVMFDWGLTDVIVNCCVPLCLADFIALWYMAINAFVTDAIVTFLWNRSILRL